jgi:hypothetical protein
MLGLLGGGIRREVESESGAIGLGTSEHIPVSTLTSSRFALDIHRKPI